MTNNENKMSENKKNSKRKLITIIWGLITGSPLKMWGGPYNNIFEFIAEGDTKREEEITYSFAKISHIISLSLVLVAILANTLMLVFHEESSETINGKAIFLTYFGSFFLLIASAFWPKIVNWRTWSKHSKTGVFFNHSFRLIFFMLITLLGFISGIDKLNTFTVIIPIYLLSIIALVLTFPTKGKWKEWSS